MLILQLIIIQGVIFAGLIFLLRKLLYSHIARALKRLQQLNEDNLQKEEELKRKIQRTEAECKMQIEKAKQEGLNVIEQAKEQAVKIKDDLLEQSKKDADLIIARAVEQKEKMQADMAAEMEQNSVKLACDIIQHIFSSKVEQSVHNQLTNEIIEDMAKIDKERMEIDNDKVDIITAYPIIPAQKERLEKILSDVANKKISVEEEVDKKIVAGIIVKSGSLLIDGSLKNKLQKAFMFVKERMTT